jgi:hypothetical protein
MAHLPRPRSAAHHPVWAATVQPSPRDIDLPAAATQIALENACGALVALEASRATIGSATRLSSATAEIARAEAAVIAATESVRRAIEALRALSSRVERSELALGFVREREGPSDRLRER